MQRSTSFHSSSSITWPDGSPTSMDTPNGGPAAFEKHEKQQKKGLLAFTQTVATMMALFNLGLFTTANSMSSDNPWMKILCSGSIVPLVSSTILAALASYYKESELIDNAGFQVLKTLLVFQFTHFYVVLFIIMRVRANVSLTVVLCTGVSGCCLIVLIGVISINQTRQFMKKSTKAAFQFLKTWTKIMWERMGYLHLRSQIQNLPEPA